MAKRQMTDAQKKMKEKCKIITPMFRVSYPHVFKAQSPKEGDKKKFSITMMFPKDKPMVGSYIGGEEISIAKVMTMAKRIEFGDDKADWPKNLESPIVDGDDPDHAEKEGYKGHWIIKATTSEEQRPGVVDAEGTPMTNPADLYPGCYARAYVYCYVWTYMKKQGVGFILDHVQKMKDGKAFGGKKPIEQVFSPVGALDDGDDESEDLDEVSF